MRSPAEWPIRWRLTLVFSAAMALVLAAAGAVTVVQFRDAAHEADPDGALRGLTDDITADLVRELVTILPIVLVIAAVAAYLLSRADRRRGHGGNSELHDAIHRFLLICLPRCDGVRLRR